MTRPPNKELKLTKPGTIGASQLNSSVVRTVGGVMRPAWLCRQGPTEWCTASQQTPSC